MNSIVVCGNLGRTPELKYTTSGKPCAKFSIADSVGKDQQGNEVTQWFHCTAFGRTAELIVQYFSKGHPVYVTGKLWENRYTKRDKTPGFSLDVLVDSFQFVPFGGQRKETDPADPTPPASYQRAEPEPSAEPQPGDMPNIDDPFADQ